MYHKKVKASYFLYQQAKRISTNRNELNLRIQETID